MLTTSKTVRVQNVPWNVSKNTFESVVNSLVVDPRRARKSTSSMSDHQVQQFKYTFATDFEEEQRVGTITFHNEKQKKKALNIKYEGWKFDHQFCGVTVLQSPANANLE